MWILIPIDNCTIILLWNFKYRAFSPVKNNWHPTSKHQMFLRSIFDWIARMLEFFSFAKRSVSGLGVFVKTTTGETVYVELDPKWDIASVKQIVSKKIGIDSSELKIIFAGKELQDSVTIRVSTIPAEHIVDCIIASLFLPRNAIWAKRASFMPSRRGDAFRNISWPLMVWT